MTQSRKARRGDPKKAVAYLRASTDEQLLSPDTQRTAITTWATREGVEVLSFHEDLDVSGGSDLDQRPGFLAALGALRTQKAGLLVIARRDRLARDVAIAALLERAVAQHGARLVSADGIANGTQAADALLRTILDGAAAYEKALIRQRTRDAMQALRAQGRRAGTVPYGYTADETGRLTPEPQEQAVLARIRELADLGYSQRALVAQLAADGVRSRAGTPLGLTQVARLVRGHR